MHENNVKNLRIYIMKGNTMKKTAKARNINIFGGGGSLTLSNNKAFGGFKSQHTNIHVGFTLAEMMVVMLILSVVMAAFAPIMTRRNKADLSNASPWKMVTAGESHIYYTNSIAHDSKAVAQIGAKMEQSDLTSNDINSRLLIATNSQAPNAISFGWRTNGTPAFTKLADMAVLRNSNDTNGRMFWGTPNSGTIDNNLGNYSLAIGIGAKAGKKTLMLDDAQSYSTAIGNDAKAASYSTAVGYGATAGPTDNTVIQSVTIGNNTVAQSVAIGNNAKAGISSISIGKSAAGSSDISTNNNIAIGVQSLYNNTGDSNTAIGNFALQSNTTGSHNVAIGYGTISSINNNNVNTGSKNVAIGYDTLLKNSSGEKNVAIGETAQKENTTGSDNVAIGYQALQSNKIGSGNTAIGYNALVNAVGRDTRQTRNDWLSDLDLVISQQAPVQIIINDVKAGEHNTAIGYNSLSSTTTGGTNIAVGKESGGTITTGSNNIALGLNALGGYWNGSSTDSSNTTGSDNIAIGQYALSHGGAFNGNIAIGAGNLQHLTSGGSNIAIGPNAMSEKTSGSKNIAIGLNALNYSTTGSNNIAIGDGACYYVSSGSNKTCIGGWSGVGMSSTLQENDAYAAFLGGGKPYESNGDHSSVTYIGGTSIFNNGDAVLEVHNKDHIQTASPGFEQGWGRLNGCSGISDEGALRICRRTKPSSTVVINGNLVVKGYIMTRLFLPAGDDGDSAEPGAAILGLSSAMDDYVGWYTHVHVNNILNDTEQRRNINGVWDSLIGIANKRSIGLGNYTDFSTSDRRLKNIQGVNNEGLEKIKQLKVYNFTFKNDAKKLPHTGVIAQDLQKIFPNAVTKGEDGYLRIRWDEMFYAMVNSIKELAAKVTGLEDRLTKLEKENQELKAQNSELAKRLTILENKIK